MSEPDRLEEMVRQIRQIPTLRRNIERINTMIDNHHTAITAIAGEISKDQSLAAQILKVVNSGFYGFSNKVSSISQAVVLLGLNVVRSLVSTSWAADLIAKSFPGLYEHSLACARACHVISRNLGVDDPDEVGTVGLLHDIGKVILAGYLPDQFHAVSELVREKNMLFHDAELEATGTTHGEIGRWLMEKWNLPEATIGPIAMHHDFTPSAAHARRTAVVVLADVMIRAEGFGYGGDNRVPDLTADVLDTLRLDTADFRPLMDEIVDQMHDIARFQETSGE